MTFFPLLLRLAAAAPGGGLDRAVVLAGRAERSLVERALAESGAERVPRGPGWTSYLQEAVGEAARRLLHDLLGRLEPFLGSFGQSLAIVTFAGICLALLVLFVVGVRLALRGRSARPPATPPRVREIERSDFAADRTRAQWREELERRLAADDVPAALEALWWWFARSLGEVRVDPAWTSRELLAASRRLDLAPQALRLDGMMYGPRRPVVAETRSLLAHLEEVLG